MYMFLSQGFPCPSKKGDLARDFFKCILNFLSRERISANMVNNGKQVS